MERSRVKAGTKGLSAQVVLERGRTIAAMLKDNANFPTLQAMLPAFEVLLDDLETASNLVLFNGGKVSFEAKRIADKAVRGAIKNFASLVQAISSGDRAMILSAGFDVAKARTPAPAPTTPTGLTVRRTDKFGILKLRWQRVPAGKVYYVDMKAEGGDWERIHITTRASHVVDQLRTGLRYTFRVQAQTSTGISQLSEEVSNIAA